jgi:hypothetical protein
MEIHESCRGWDMIFTGKDIPKATEVEIQLVSDMLHTVGDAVGAIASLDEDELRERVMQAFTYIMSEARFNMEAALHELIEASAWQTPLEGEFSSESLFGCSSLQDALMELTYNDDEREIVEGMFPPRPEEGEEYDDTGD